MLRKKIYSCLLVGLAALALVVALGLSYLLSSPNISEEDFKAAMAEVDPLIMPAEPRPPLQEESNKDLLDQIPAEHSNDRIMLEELLKLEEQEGRKIGMVHYIKAGWVVTDDLIKLARNRQNLGALIRKALMDGWGEDCGELIPWLDAWQPAFEEIRKGAALDYGCGIGVLKNAALTPVPNFSFAQTAAKALCVEGRYLEYQGRFPEALDNYLVTLTMGRDSGVKGSTLIGNLIGISIETIALRQICRIAKENVWEEDDLEHALRRLREIENTNGSVIDAFRIEHAYTLWGIKKTLSSPNYRTSFSNRMPPPTLMEFVVNVFDKRARARYFENLMFRAAVRWRADRAIPDQQECNELRMRYFTEPWWSPERERLEEMYLGKAERSHILVRLAVPNHEEAEARNLVTQTKLRGAQLAVALALWRIDRNYYPEALGAIAPYSFDGALPIDLFSGEHYLYSPSNDRKDYTLRSVGPDSENNGGAIIYDPTNGTLSVGDIVF